MKSWDMCGDVAILKHFYIILFLTIKRISFTFKFSYSSFPVGSKFVISKTLMQTNISRKIQTGLLFK